MTKIKLFICRTLLIIADKIALMEAGTIWNQILFIYGNYKRAGVGNSDAVRETLEYVEKWYKQKLDENWFERFGV